MSKLVFSLLVTVIGLVVVFAVLVILSFIASLLKYANLIPTRESIKKKLKREKKPVETPAAEIPAAGTTLPAIEQEPVSVTEAIDPDELNAVIAAAISAYIASEPLRTVCDNGIVVRSVRRAGQWNSAGRYDRLSNKI